MTFWLKHNTTDFPSLQKALRQPNGLLAMGGDLSSQRLIAAYRHGCFPWYAEGQPLMWWSPDPRTVVFPNQLHIPRSLKKNIKRGTFQVTYDQAFARVLSACAEPRSTDSGTWITPAMQAAYCELHKLGYAHSVEVWHQQQLVGGLYGIAIGQLFFGESMFARMNDASKVGFVTLVQDLKAAGFVLIDCQMHTEHLARFGAQEINRSEFADYLAQHLDKPNTMQWNTHE
ncbi:MAG: leucyl/phenylalanyl-tRNA--protein transferase [Gammaproteobacteria bacterium]|nr:leucyl/phenylalanyl-tRNA--protein transferase [Gammaproteobacteria bacterium]